MSDLSTFLFARPSFVEGLGRLVDFGGMLNEYNYSPTGEQADAFAAWADWSVVGSDMRIAWIDELERAKELERSNVTTLEKAKAPS